MLEFQLPDYSILTVGMIAIYALAGLFGALVRVAWLDKPLRGFYRDEEGGLHMGFFAEVIIGVAVAIAVDGHPVRAGIAAVFAPFILEGLRAVIVQKDAFLQILVKPTPEPPKKSDGEVSENEDT